MSEVKSNRAWRLECEELRSRLVETEARAEKINDEGRSNAAYWYERAMKAEAQLAEARGAIESAVRCLTMCNDGPREALLILNAYKSRNREWRTDSTSEVKP
jgi:hypothetical protein